MMKIVDTMQSLCSHCFFSFFKENILTKEIGGKGEKEENILNFLKIYHFWDQALGADGILIKQGEYPPHG